ncbi:argininosuccinate lyase [bacterium]|jgi:argininosuccinate lyase|nr:argininosuccinate lyase [bacterium]
MAKVWGGRFEKDLDQSAIDLSFGFEVDQRLYRQDIAVNIAHTTALAKIGLLSETERDTLIEALNQLPEQFEKEILGNPQPDEDIHSCVERLVVEKCGDLGKKMHSGKSRNDQIATDMRLYLKTESKAIIALLQMVLETIVSVADSNKKIIFPGFTHLQIAQPILLSHHLLAYHEKFKRDLDRFQDGLERMDECPLGSAAMAGSNYPVDREAIAKDLGFARITQNSMDAVSDRDYMLEYTSAAAICMGHLSQISEELILWSSQLVGFITIGDEFTTGSSIMPQKKNPDMAELIRGKTGPVLADFVGLHEMIKGLPMTYNRDLQEDKPLVFHAGDTLKACLTCFAPMLSSIEFHEKVIHNSLHKGFILATEIADYLAQNGTPFREAHEITGRIVQYAEKENKSLEELTIEELARFSDQLQADISHILQYQASVDRKDVVGGTASQRVATRIKELSKQYSK